MNPQQQFEPQTTQAPVHKTVTFGEAVQMVVLPKFQRPENEIHTKEMLNNELKHEKERGHLLFPHTGVIVLGKTPGSKKMSVLDGQHRVSVMMKLIQINPKYSEEKVNIVIIHGDVDYFHDTYNSINSNIKADIMWSRNTTEVINQTITRLMKDFKEFSVTTKTPHRPNINFGNLLKAIKESKIVETLGVVEDEDLYGKLMELNDFYQCFAMTDFKKCGITLSKPGLEEKKGKKFYLGFWNKDFEFLARIIQKHRDNIPYYEQDHSLWANKVEKVTKSIEKRKDKVEGCGCCGKELVKEDNGWCWKKSLYIGGKIEMGNVVFVCEQCMEETGKQGFNEYMISKEKQDEKIHEVQEQDGLSSGVTLPLMNMTPEAGRSRDIVLATNDEVVPEVVPEVVTDGKKKISITLRLGFTNICIQSNE
jgi:hypothetical protein